MKWIKVFLALLALCSVERFCHKQTHGFRVHKITSKDSVVETALPQGAEKEALKTILSQPYHFLASGGECYAFASEDGHYVIKCFKHHHMREHSVLDLLTDKWKKARTKKRARLFASCLIAHERLPEETGLIALHLSKTPGYFNQTLTLIDRIGIAHCINLDQIDFALQHRGILALDVLKTDKNPRHLDAIFQLIKARCMKGVADRDPIFKRNLAFVGDRAIAIDLGAFVFDESLKNPCFAHRALFFETLKLKRWLYKNAPELLPHFEERLNNEIY